MPSNALKRRSRWASDASFGHQWQIQIPLVSIAITARLLAFASNLLSTPLH
jgi:hypothetical protein